MNFEWDEQKCRSNLEKHGVDFLDAIQVFSDENHSWGYDAEHSVDEDRWWAVGRVENGVLFIVTTERARIIRVISARRATRDEQREYYESLAR